MRYPILLLSFVFVYHAYGQSPEEAGVLLQRLRLSKADTARVDILQDLSLYYIGKIGEFSSDLDSAESLNNEAEGLSRKLDFPYGVGRSIYVKGKLLEERKDRNGARDLYNRAFEFGGKNNLYKLQGDTRLALAHISNAEADDSRGKVTLYEEALALYRKAGAKYDEGRTLAQLGDILQTLGQYDQAIPLLQQSLDVFNSIGHKQVESIYFTLCEIYREKGDFPQALHYGLMAEKIADGNPGTRPAWVNIYNQLALTYYDVKNDSMALLYFQKSVDAAVAGKDTASVLHLSINIGTMLLRLNRPQDALALLKSTLKDYPPQSDVYRLHLADLLLNTYVALKDDKMAFVYYKQLVNFHDQLTVGDPSRGYTSRSIVEYLLFARQYRQSYSYIDELKAEAVKNNNLIRVSQSENYYFKADSGMGKYPEAIRHYELYKMWNDSIFNIDKNKQCTALQLQFETEKKDDDIRSLQKESRLQHANKAKDTIIKNVIIGGIVMLLLLLGLLYRRYRLKQRSNIQLQQKQQEINLQNDLLKKLLGEKEWLLKEIHHRVKNNLQIVISLLNTQSAYLDNEDALLALKSSQQRMHSMSLIHQRLYQSDNLAMIDMHWYIHELAGYMRESFGVDRKVQFVLDTEKVELDVIQAVPLGLILNEAISNAIKYAFPGDRKGEVRISLHTAAAPPSPSGTTGSDVCRLVIADNGIGLPPGFDPENFESLGMSLMRGLTDQLGGTFEMDGQKGLAITITFPVTRGLSAVG
jgi:two-component sensor histidine kinase